MKKATSSSTGTVIGSPLRPIPSRRVRQRRLRRRIAAQLRRLDGHRDAVLTLVLRRLFESMIAVFTVGAVREIVAGSTVVRKRDAAARR